MIHEHLRMPAQNAVHHDARLGLALRHQVAVHVEAIMVVAPGDAPGLVLLERPRVVGADGHRVVPGGEPLVTIGVGGRVEHQHDVLQNRPRHRVLTRQHLVGDLQRGLESRRFVAVNASGDIDPQRVGGSCRCFAGEGQQIGLGSRRNVLNLPSVFTPQLRAFREHGGDIDGIARIAV